MKSKIFCVFFGLFLLLPLSGNVWSGDEDQENSFSNMDELTIMHPDHDTLLRWKEAYENAPEAFIDEKLMAKIPFEGSFNLFDHFYYVPSERSQGSCGNCWAWAGTGVMEVAHSVQTGIKDRLSIQYINSCLTEVISSKFACCSGNADTFATFYTGTGKTIPWSNTSASYQDARTLCSYGASSVSCGGISTSPSYGITSINDTKIVTHGVGKTTAINNIKNVLHQGKAIFYSFCLPTSSDLEKFYNFWQNDNISIVFNFDFSCGHDWEDGGGCHAVLILGYNDDDPGNRYWIALNSWGATGNRPQGVFRVDMDMDYDCTYNWGENGTYNSHYFQTLDIVFAGGASTTTTSASSITTTSTNPYDLCTDPRYLEPCIINGDLLGCCPSDYPYCRYDDEGTPRCYGNPTTTTSALSTTTTSALSTTTTSIVECTYGSCESTAECTAALGRGWVCINGCCEEVDSGGCPISKALEDDESQLDTIRRFRDEVLSQTPEGREIIKLYYHWSPVIVKAMEQDEGFKEEVKELIDGVLELITEEVE